MTIKEAQQQVDSYIKKHGVRYFSELTNMAILTEEVGEVARIIQAIETGEGQSTYSDLIGGARAEAIVAAGVGMPVGSGAAHSWNSLSRGVLDSGVSSTSGVASPAAIAFKR